MKTSDQLISVVVPIHNEAALLPAFLQEATEVLGTHYDQFELLLVDNGSDDGTDVQMAVLLEKWKGIRYLRLSRRFDTQTALTAGLDVAIGDICVTLMPETDPVALVPQLVESCAKSKALVVGQCRTPSGGFTARAIGWAFHMVCAKLLGIHYPRHSTFLAALPRTAISQMAKVRDKFRFLTTLHSHLGMPYSLFPYDAKRAPRRGVLSQAWASINASLDMVVTNSIHPLRLVTIGSLMLSFANLAYMGYIVAIFFFKPNPAEGWVTASSQNAMNFFLLFLTLSVLSEYLGRLLMESKDRPSYFIVEERNSAERVAGESRLNTLSEARVAR
jgi:hypothetical protein